MFKQVLKRFASNENINTRYVKNYARMAKAELDLIQWNNRIANQKTFTVVMGILFVGYIQKQHIDKKFEELNKRCDELEKESKEIRKEFNELKNILEFSVNV